MAGRFCLAAALLFVLPAQAQTMPGDIILHVGTGDDLPGFRQSDEAQYLADQMQASGVKGWRFVAEAPSRLSGARIEWHFTADPYAGGEVRQFFPIAGVRKMFGARHLITAEVRLYLDGQYQTLMYGQANVAGGAKDPDLAAFVTRMTQGLLGETGAYRSIDMTPATP